MSFNHDTTPNENGFHPTRSDLVLAEIEPHYGMWLVTTDAAPGSLLISDDDAMHMFGDQYDAEYGYISSEYLELFQG